MAQVMKATEVGVHFGEVMRRVSRGGAPIIVERAGQPQVAIISLTDYVRLEQLQAGSNVRAALETGTSSPAAYPKGASRTTSTRSYRSSASGKGGAS
jgi:prevent-host-death family protein